MLCTSVYSSASNSRARQSPFHPPNGVGDYDAEIVEIRNESPTIKSFWLDYGDQPFTFIPGQWIDLYARIDGHDAVGGYSIVSEPSVQGRLQLAVKFSNSHVVTNYLHQRADIGDQVRISKGQGAFRYEPWMSKRLVLLAGGIGVTPLLSILRYVYKSAPDVSVTLIYSVSDPADILFRHELDLMSASRENIRCFYTVTRPNQYHWRGFEGRINRVLLDEVGVDNDALYYFCGPPMFVEDMAHDLIQDGLSKDRLVYEKWW